MRLSPDSQHESDYSGMYWEYKESRVIGRDIEGVW